MTDSELLALAAETGFSHYGMLNIEKLDFMPAVREMCAAGRCRMYNSRWTCPPYSATTIP